MDYQYTADISPTESIINVHCICMKCEHEEFADVIATIGHSTTSWEYICPECDSTQWSETYTEKLFD
jgi:hypothetical protein